MILLYKRQDKVDHVKLSFTEPTLAFVQVIYLN